MTKLTRTDIHRPSAINPEDYSFVGCEVIKFDGMDSCFAQMMERERIQRHMEETGGSYSKHAHGGNCHICGNDKATYTMLFYHEKTNSYIRVGQDCADKLDVGPEAFRKLTKLRDGINQERAVRAGKQKAQKTLESLGIGKAWDIYNGKDDAWEENTVRDIVGKLVTYGSMSTKQVEFVKKLIAKIENRPQIEAEKAAKYANAADVPVVEGRTVLQVKVLSAKWRDTGFGRALKITAEHEEGWKVYGTAPSGLEVEKGDKIKFSAKLERSKDDPKFGFFSRPTKGEIVEKAK